jgi:hypothetical protein
MKVCVVLTVAIVWRVAMVMLLMEAYYVHVLLSLSAMYMHFYTTQHSYYNLDIRSYLRQRYIKLYYIIIYSLFYDAFSLTRYIASMIG